MKPFTEHSFQTYLSEHKLMAAKCEDCGGLFVPPRPMCPVCHSEQMAWVEVSGKGKLAAFTAVYIGPNAMIAAGYDRKNPYMTGVVQLDEGPLISAQILGLDATQPNVSAIGTPLTVEFIERGEEEAKRTFLAFQG
ncbi:MAG: Zn-ribbon domain-containing OB-fold protein [Anaerolineae bacterium]